MATINPYTGNVVHFPPGTPYSVINSYMAALARNQAVKANYDPWSSTIDAFQKQVLNPFLSTYAQQPFQDYRQTYNTNETIRQQQELYNSQVRAKNEEALNAYALAQQQATDLGTAGGQMLTDLQSQQEPYIPGQAPPVPLPPANRPPFPDTGTPPIDTRSLPDTSAYAGGPDTTTPQQPEQPSPFDIGGYAGPQPMPPANERPPGPGQQGAPGPPQDLQQYPPGGANTGRVMVNSATGERFRSDGTQWVPIPAPGAQTAAPPTAPATTPAAPATVPFTPMKPPTLPNPTPMVPFQPRLADAIRMQSGENPLNAGLMIQAIEKNPTLAGILDPLRQNQLAALIEKTQAQTGNVQSGTGLNVAKTLTLNDLRDPQIQALLAQAGYRQAQTGVDQGKIDTQKAIQDTIGQLDRGEITPADAQAKIGLLQGKTPGAGQSPFTKTMQGAIAIVGSFPENQGKSPQELAPIADRYLRDQGTQDAANRARDAAAARAPATIAVKGIEDIKQQQDQFNTVQLHLASLKPAVDLLAEAGALPTDPTLLTEWETKLTRQMPEIWTKPGVQTAWGVVRQFYSSAIGSYDRAVLGIKGMRAVKDMYALPSDATLLPVGQIQGSMDFMQTGMDNWNQSANSRLQAYQQAIQTGSLNPIIQGGEHAGEVHVIELSSGLPGWIPTREFDPGKYKIKVGP